MARLLVLHLAVATLAIAGCSGRAEPPTPDDQPPPPPNLSGVDVMVLPAQPAPGGSMVGGEAVAGLDAEIAFWLAELGTQTRWVFPPEIDRALARSPSFTVRPRALAVSSFHVAEVRNIGDPLFGDLRSLNALLNARYALVPVSAAYTTTATGQGHVEIRAALIDTIGGRVLWFGAVAGDAGPASDRSVVASAARALADALFIGGAR